MKWCRSILLYENDIFEQLGCLLWWQKFQILRLGLVSLGGYVKLNVDGN
jgi:hypothetical protein